MCRLRATDGGAATDAVDTDADANAKADLPPPTTAAAAATTTLWQWPEARGQTPQPWQDFVPRNATETRLLVPFVAQ